MAQQRVTDLTLSPGMASAAGADFSQSGQGDTGGSGSVFGDLGGPGQQQGTGAYPIQDGPRNAEGHPNGNPSGSMGAVPPHDGVFGDLGGSGVAGQTGGAPIPNIPSRDPGGQGGY